MAGFVLAPNRVKSCYRQNQLLTTATNYLRKGVQGHVPTSKRCNLEPSDWYFYPSHFRPIHNYTLNKFHSLWSEYFRLVRRLERPLLGWKFRYILKEKRGKQESYYCIFLFMVFLSREELQTYFNDKSISHIKQENKYEISHVNNNKCWMTSFANIKRKYVLYFSKCKVLYIQLLLLEIVIVFWSKTSFCLKILLESYTRISLYKKKYQRIQSHA